MSWFQLSITYLVSWWLVLFMVLPLWVRTPQKPEPGHAPSAPEHPHLRRKFLLTSLLAFIPVLALMGIMDAHAASGIYHAGSGKCPPKATYVAPADINAKDNGATLNPNPMADKIGEDTTLKLEIPSAPYLKNGQQDPNGPSPYNADLSQSNLQMGEIHVKKNGESTLNGQPIGGQDDGCDDKADNKKK